MRTRRTAGRSWMRVAEDQVRWREVEEAYVQADDDDDDDTYVCTMRGSNP
jgi:hypothetical protein